MKYIYSSTSTQGCLVMVDIRDISSAVCWPNSGNHEGETILSLKNGVQLELKTSQVTELLLAWQTTTNK